jgi:hypothetical protein
MAVIIDFLNRSRYFFRHDIARSLKWKLMLQNIINCIFASENKRTKIHTTKTIIRLGDYSVRLKLLKYNNP